LAIGLDLVDWRWVLLGNNGQLRGLIAWRRIILTDPEPVGEGDLQLGAENKKKRERGRGRG